MKKEEKFNLARFLKGMILKEEKEIEQNEDYLVYLKREFEKAKEK